MIYLADNLDHLLRRLKKVAGHDPINDLEIKVKSVARKIELLSEKTYQSCTLKQKKLALTDKVENINSKLKDYHQELDGNI